MGLLDGESLVGIGQEEFEFLDTERAAGRATPAQSRQGACLQKRPRVLIQEPVPEQVTVDNNGWVRCPKCLFKFKLSDRNAWDGKRHKRCLQPLQVQNQ